MSEQDDIQTTPTDDFASQLELEPEQTDEKEQPESKPAEEEKAEQPVEAEESPEKQPEKPDEETPAEKTDEEKQQESEDERKERNRKFYEQRQQQKRQVEKAIDQAYKPQGIDDLAKKYQEEGYDDFQAKMLARDEQREQQAAIGEARVAIAELNSVIETEAVQVMHEFPIFDPKSSDYDKDFHQKAITLYNRSAGIQRDPNTNLIVHAEVTPYEFFKDLAELRSSGMSKAQVAAQAAAQAQMAAVTPPTSTAPTVRKSAEDEQADALAAAFDKV